MAMSPFQFSAGAPKTQAMRSRVGLSGVKSGQNTLVGAYGPSALRPGSTGYMASGFGGAPRSDYEKPKDKPNNPPPLAPIVGGTSTPVDPQPYVDPRDNNMAEGDGPNGGRGGLTGEIGAPTEGWLAQQLARLGITNPGYGDTRLRVSPVQVPIGPPVAGAGAGAGGGEGTGVSGLGGPSVEPGPQGGGGGGAPAGASTQPGGQSDVDAEAAASAAAAAAAAAGYDGSYGPQISGGGGSGTGAGSGLSFDGSYGPQMPSYDGSFGPQQPAGLPGGSAPQDPGPGLSYDGSYGPQLPGPNPDINQQNDLPAYDGSYGPQQPAGLPGGSMPQEPTPTDPTLEDESAVIAGRDLPTEITAMYAGDESNNSNTGTSTGQQAVDNEAMSGYSGGGDTGGGDTGGGDTGGGGGGGGGGQGGAGGGGGTEADGSGGGGFARGGYVDPRRLTRPGAPKGLAQVGGRNMGGYSQGGPVPNYAEGGMVDEAALAGPNPAGPDDGFAALDGGEYVVQAQQAQRPDYAPILAAMNAGAYQPGMEGEEAEGEEGTMPGMMPAEGHTTGDPGALPPDQQRALMDAMMADPVLAQALAQLLGPDAAHSLVDSTEETSPAPIATGRPPLAGPPPIPGAHAPPGVRPPAAAMPTQPMPPMMPPRPPGPGGLAGVMA